MKIRLTQILNKLIGQKATYVCCVISDIITNETPDGERALAIGNITLALNEQLVKLEPGLFHEGTYGRISILEDWIRWNELHNYPSLLSLTFDNGTTMDDCGFLDAFQFRAEMLRFLIETHGDIELTF